MSLVAAAFKFNGAEGEMAGLARGRARRRAGRGGAIELTLVRPLGDHYLAIDMGIGDAFFWAMSSGNRFGSTGTRRGQRAPVG